MYIRQIHTTIHALYLHRLYLYIACNKWIEIYRDWRKSAGNKFQYWHAWKCANVPLVYYIHEHSAINQRNTISVVIHKCIHSFSLHFKYMHIRLCKHDHRGLVRKIRTHTFDVRRAHKVSEYICAVGSSVNSGCVLECRDTPTSHCATPISTLMVTYIHLYSPHPTS